MSLFICHGSPSLVLEKNEYTNFLRRLGQNIRPKAIVIFSAHWESDILTISSMDSTYEMIYDFGGFSKDLYSIQYSAKGSIVYASMLKDKLENRGIPVKEDKKRGLDHGSWVVLQLMYPEANIPIVQVSINPKLPPAKQYEIGQSIKELRMEEILVIGSGGTVHNLRTVKWEAKTPEAWAVEFDDWLIDKIQNKDLKALFDYQQLAPYAQQAVPSEEHIAPLFITMGCGENGNSPKLLHRSYDYGTLSHICFEF